MSATFGFNPETAIAVFLGLIAYAKLRSLGRGSSCECECAHDEPAPTLVAHEAVAAPVAAPVAAAPVAAPVTAVPAAAPASAPAAVDDALMAVLSAAVAVTCGPNARIVGVLSPKYDYKTLMIWSREGRREIYLSHRITTRGNQ
jgi:hypothetical protein